MPRRPANTVRIIGRRLSQAEMADAVDAMELLSIYDELARVERKWEMQFAAGSERRKPADRDKLNAWFARLGRQVTRSLRASPDASAAAAVLRDVQAKCAARNG
jgi:hypothetical protein